MGDDYQIIKYAGATPGADVNTYNLFDSTVYSASARGPIRFASFMRYVLALKNAAVGTIKAYGSMDKGATWIEFYELAVPISTVQRMNQIAIALEPHVDVKIDWVNGGAAQTTWYVGQALDDGQVPIRTVFLDAAGDADPGASTAVTAVQLPSSLGPKVTASSLSVTQATDSAEHAAASMRAPLRSEILVFAATTASVTWNIPDGSIVGQPDWRGKLVNVFADGSDIYLQIATTTGAVADDAQLSTVTTVGGRSSAAPQGNEVWPLKAGQWYPIPIPANALSFALKAVAACKLRTHPAQT